MSIIIFLLALENKFIDRAVEILLESIVHTKQKSRLLEVGNQQAAICLLKWLDALHL